MTTLLTASLQSLSELPDQLATTEGFPEVLQALSEGRSATIDGTWGPSATLTTAALASHAPSKILVVLAHPSDLDRWQGDLTTFDGERPEIFPAWDTIPTELVELDSTGSQRLRLLRQLESESPPRIILSTLQALLQPVPGIDQLESRRRVLQVGEEIDMEDLAVWLVEQGFRSVDRVELPGEFSRRGGILDLFSPDVENPWRLEFFGDEIESIREFDAGTQRSLEDLSRVTATGSLSNEESGYLSMTGHLCDYLARDAWTVLVELEELHDQGKQYLERVSDWRGLITIDSAMKKLTSVPSIRLSSFPVPSTEVTCHLNVESVERFSGNVALVRDELDSIAVVDRAVIACHNEAEVARLTEVLSSGKLAQSERLQLVTGQVHAGFRLVDFGLVVLGGQELFHREGARQVLPRRQIESRAIDSFLDLKEGDYVVHVSHGIALYRGMQVLDKNGREEEHLLLEFRAGARVYVPASKIDLVQKYVGGSKVNPELSKVGGTGWTRKKEKVE